MNKSLYLSICKSCAGGLLLKDVGVREVAYPFDWSGQSYKSIADILDNGFKDTFINYEKAYVEKDFDCIIWEKKYNLLLIHEPDLEVHLIKGRYIRRYNRLINDLKNTEEVFLIPSPDNEHPLRWHFEKFQHLFKEPIPSEEILGQGTIDDVKDAILRVNPNIKFIFPEKFEYHEVIRSIKKHAKIII